MAVEGSSPIVAGIVAGSIALIGFGLDSRDRGLRQRGDRVALHRLADALARRRGARAEAGRDPVLHPRAVRRRSSRSGRWSNGIHAEESIVGIALAAEQPHRDAAGSGERSSASGARIGSSATASEGKQNLLCAYLAAALLVGLLGNALVGAWWLDSARRPASSPCVAVLRGSRGVARRRLLRPLTAPPSSPLGSRGRRRPRAFGRRRRSPPGTRSTSQTGARPRP